MGNKLQLLFIITCLSACATKEYKNKAALKEILSEPSTDIINSSNEEIQEVEESEIEDEAILVADQNDNTSKQSSLPIQAISNKKFSLEYINAHYDQWVQYFLVKDKERFFRFLANANKYRTVIESIFEEHGLPKELFFVGLIESGYYTRAKSHAGAQGPWQFMKGTGKHYGLRVDHQVDERLNIFKATHAAASYFKDLYNIFGNWELALCAYNAGEYRIIGAIRKGNTRSYKELVRKKLIPAETAHYVPKMAAAMNVTQKLFSQSNKQNELSQFYQATKAMKINKSFNVNKLVKNLGISREHFMALNADLKASSIRVKGGHRLYVPDQNVNTVKLADISPDNEVIEHFKEEKKSRKIASKKSVAKKVHVVRKGQNLSVIARKYKLSVAKLKAMNNLKKNRVYSGQKLKIVRHGLIKHVVKSGENLHLIAKKYEVPFWSIKKENRLKRDVLWVGQIIKVPIGSALVVDN